MRSTSVSVIVMLVALVSGARSEDDIQPCATVHTSSPVVPLGSPVTASCVIRDDCPLAAGRDVLIEWRLGNRLISGRTATNGSARASEVIIPSFNLTTEVLTCCVQASPGHIVVGGVSITAGYPPEAPQNLSCQTNLSEPNTLSCNWTPALRDSLLLTKYTLHTEIRDSNDNFSYELPAGVHHYAIPRSDFVLYSDMKIFVKVANELGEATSEAIVLEPISAAKFDPPRILNIQTMPKRLGCLRLSWSLSEQQVWLGEWRLNLEVRLKTANSSRWSEQTNLVNRIRSTKAVDQCRLLHGTQYLVQIRVRFRQSPWSEWSSSRSGVTLETAPSGRLDSWMKVSRDHVHKHLSVLLFWKPSKQFHANGQNVSYVVSLRKLPAENGKVCSTFGNHCVFQLPPRVRKVYLSAVNAAGKSSPTEVPVHLQKAHEVISGVTVTPRDERSLLVQWRTLLWAGVTGFVVEWRPLLQSDQSQTRFEVADRNQTKLLITGGFEPYKPYGIWVYPRCKDGIGLPQTVNAYSRQKAPSMVPKIQMKKIWQSQIEFTWDEIPLDQRNGFIQSYKVFYWDNKGPVQVVEADVEERRVVLKDLNAASLYEAFMMVDTLGGSLNGSTVNFKMESFDAVAVVAILTVSVIALLLMVVFIVLTFSNQKRLKGRFWPAVPDPANSSIRGWTSDSTQDSYLDWDDDEEPNPVYLTHLSFLDIPVKLSKEDDDPWLNNAEDTSDLGESICGSPFIPGYSGSNSDSVPYATVVFGPCSSPEPKDSHVYLRSESTQPLLEAEESFSPKCYQNMPTDGMPREQCFFGPSHDCVPETEADSTVLWDDFPFLRALAMNDTENDYD